MSGSPIHNRFAQRASLFSGKLFVNLIAYADDSGTHDETGRQTGSEAPVFGGYIGDIKDWKLFCWRWQAVLDRYKVPYFHYREFANRHSADKPNSPYHGWSDLRRDTFLFELAAIAGAQIPVGGLFNLKDYRQGGGTEYPYRYPFNTFLENVVKALSMHWPGTKEPVTFFFDQSTDPRWSTSVAKVFADWKAKEPRFSEYSFGDMRKHLPLQAADLLSYRVRRRALLRLESGIGVEPSLLDHYLFRYRDPKRKKGDTPQFIRYAPKAAQCKRDLKMGS
jgi:hypothetical protein